MSGERKVVGHKTFSDGPLTFRHEPIYEDEAKALLDEMDKRDKERAERMPNDRAALLALGEAYQRLSELGWRNAIYCPKDGSVFEVIEAGSTGIHDCHYDGEWPKGTWWIHGEGDLWPSRPILWRKKP